MQKFPNKKILRTFKISLHSAAVIKRSHYRVINVERKVVETETNEKADENGEHGRSISGK